MEILLCALAGLVLARVVLVLCLTRFDRCRHCGGRCRTLVPGDVSMEQHLFLTREGVMEYVRKCESCGRTTLRL
jgi:rRNA maturation protein Nop10